MKPCHLVSVAALVTNDEGKILLVNSPLRGWEYPGGLIEKGVDVEITGFIGICKNVEKDIVNIDFTCRYVGGELTTSEESTEVTWATPEEAFRMISFPLTKSRLTQMLCGSDEARLFCFKRENGFSVVEDTQLSIGR